MVAKPQQLGANGLSNAKPELEDTPLLKKRSLRVRTWIELMGLEILLHHFGAKLLIILFVSQHILKGFVQGFLGPCNMYLFRSYKVPASRIQVLGSVASLPWAMKPVIGLISDARPISGYNKAPYMMLSTILAAFALAAVGFVPQSALSVQGLAICFFLIQLQIATCDLLTEAKYSERMQEKPQHGPSLMSYVWFGLTAGGLCATIMIGPLISKIGYKTPYAIALLPSACILIPLFLNFMEEKKVSTEEMVVQRAQLLAQSETCILCLLMFVCTVILTILGICYTDPAVNAAASIIVAFIVLVAFSVTLRPVIAKVNAFFLMQSALSVSISGASYYFYTDSPESYPEGPHFSMEFYTSGLGIVGSICALIGIWSYKSYASDWSYRGLLLTTNVIATVLSLFDVLLFARVNKKMGIPDQFFVLGFSALGNLVSQWQWMPGVVLTSQLCPKGMEATMFALLAGCHNLGATVASNCGAYLLVLLNCEPNGSPNESLQFKNLWMAAVISTCLPAFTLMLLPAMIPDAKQTDKLLQDEGRATAGSLLRRWMGTDDPRAPTLVEVTAVSRGADLL